MTVERPQAGDVLVMVGTRKGSFLCWSDEARREWRWSNHHMGWSTHAITYDPRHNTIYAATNSAWHGAMVQRSEDGGLTWEHFNEGLDFDAAEDRRVREVWQVQAGPAERPGEVWAGTGEAGLFRSADRGAHWEPVRTFNERKFTDTWMPGGGGLILHTILMDEANPNRIIVAVSAGGGYRSDDGGVTWKPINRGIASDYLPDPNSETGTCVHKMVYHPERPQVLFQQNHGGVYRSTDGGDSWVDISEGLPSRFGFPMVIHPHDPHTVYLTPLKADVERVMPEDRMAVWRSRNDGDSWERLTNGLPEHAFLTVLRDAMATDPCAPCGVYVGTTGGQLFHSRDEGESWQMLAEYLPPILSVSAARVTG